ncbi:MAG: hypothetical protein ACP5K7_11870 [Verrucomicrobiia bacterium]|jgi:hypothetical protein
MRFIRQNKIGGFNICLFLLVYVAVFGWLNAATQQVKQAAKQPANQSVKTNIAPAQPVVVEIPRSVFIWNPKEPGFGRDPFFPVKPSEKKSIEKIQPSPSTTTNITVAETKPAQPQKPVVDIRLQGIVGGIKCILNGKSVDAGAEELVPYSQGRIRVKCNKIQGDTVSITIFYDDGTTEERDLSMSSGKGLK